MPNTKPSMRHRLYVDLLFDRPVNRTEAKYHAKHALTQLPAMPGHSRHVDRGPVPNVCVEDIVLADRRRNTED
jgi:hypothetical protein